MLAKAATEQLSTREVIVLLRKVDPEMRAAELHRWTGVSRERVRRLLVAMGMDSATGTDGRGGWNKGRGKSKGE